MHGDAVVDAVVLAGGQGRRLGGLDKAALDLHGLSSLDRVLEAASDARTSVVVGPARPTLRPVRWTLEHPRRSGPAQALRAGLALTSAPLVLVLAADVPLVDVEIVRELLAGVGSGGACEGALLVDHDGRDQPLVGVYRRAALAGRPGHSLRAMLAGLDLLRLPDPRRVAHDIDTPADLALVAGRIAQSQQSLQG